MLSPTAAPYPESARFAVFDHLDTPSLLVDLDTFTANVTEMAAIASVGGVELFPHAKTHRTIEYARRQLETGASGLTVATVAEAEAFADGGAARIVIAYPLVGETKLARVRALAKRAELILVADSVEAATAISDCFAESNMTVDLCLEIDSGMHRSGVEPADAVRLAHAVTQLPGVQLRGVLTHEGSVYRAESAGDLIAQSRAAATLMTKVANELRAVGYPIGIVSLGASASVRVVAREPGVTQVRPGIYAFNDLGQIVLGNATAASCAVRVLATVVSHPAPDRACIDAGSKSLSQDQLPPRGAALYPGFGTLADMPSWRLHRLSEEHGWLHWTGAGRPEPLEIGQQVQVIPNHVCTVFSCMGESVGIRAGRVVGRWPTIRRG